MNRRHFVQAGVTSLLVPVAAIPTFSGASRGDPADLHHFFFDQRFAEARRIAEVMSAAVVPTPVHADVTALWIGGLAHASLVTPLTMQGVTTESFYFCLRTLLADQVRVDAQVSRLGRDLHLWTLRTNNQH